MMRKTAYVFVLVILLAGAVVARASMDGTEKKNVTNKTCPVSGGPVSEKYRTEYKGQYVYTCCEGCLNEFNKNPETFVAKLSKDDQEAIKTNEVCPVSGEPVSKSISVEFEGRKVYFCCEHCVEKYKKDHPAAK
jgi:YHS domain-containing protein